MGELKKEKIFKRVLAYTKLIVNNINNKLEIKNEEIERIREEYNNMNKNYNWYEFRPPLNDILTNNKNLNLDLGDADIDNVKSLSKSKKIFEEKNMYNSLKIIEKINNIIDTQEIENIKFDPLPLSNMCCLSNIDDNYNYL